MVHLWPDDHHNEHANANNDERSDPRKLQEGNGTSQTRGRNDTPGCTRSRE